MKLHIKYMVSLRCRMVVREELKKLGISNPVIDLGTVEIHEGLTLEQYEQLNIALLRWGLELMEDQRAILIEKIKNVVIEMVHYSNELPRINYSNYISEKVGNNYTYLANLFSETTGATLKHFIIMHKIEKAKELLLYDELTLTEISHRLDYSSVAHLSNQFKKITGLAPSFYKKLKKKRRINLEDL